MCLMLRHYAERQRTSVITPPLHHAQLHKCVFAIKPDPSLALLIVGFRSLHQRLVTNETMMTTLA